MKTQTIASWTIEFDKAATQAAYAALSPAMDCTCQTCQNFEKAAPSLPKAVFDFFEQFGIDLLKPPEVYDIRGCNDDGRVFYGGWYHIIGNYLEGDDAWQSEGKNPPPLFEVAEDFKIGFTRSVSPTREGFPRPIVQMEVYFYLPWVLGDNSKKQTDNKGKSNESN